MAGLFRIDPTIEDEEDFLGIPKTQGMFDDAFSGMGRAPVNELFAGKHSAAIDDRDFENVSRDAEKVRQAGLLRMEDAINASPEFNKTSVERNSAVDGRRAIRDETGLELYPGHMQSGVDKPIYMTEFSDEDSRWRSERIMDYLKHQRDNKEVTYLGDIFEHDKLYEHYPEAQFMPVYLGDKMADGHHGSYYPPRSMDDGIGQVHLNEKASPEKAREVLLHELQHFIQGVEGWESGGSASKDLAIDYMRHLKKQKDESPISGLLADQVDDKMSQSDGILPMEKEYDAADAFHWTAYGSLTGEQLARDVTARDRQGHAEEYYYDGGTDQMDRGERGLWNPKESDFMPMMTMPQYRKMMTERGILGPMSVEGEILEDYKNRSDPYIDEYMGLLEKAFSK